MSCFTVVEQKKIIRGFDNVIGYSIVSVVKQKMAGSPSNANCGPR